MNWYPKPIRPFYNLPESDESFEVRKNLSSLERQRREDGSPVTIQGPSILKPKDLDIVIKAYKSDAQRKYFHAAEERGDIDKETVDEWDEKSKGKKLPKKVTKGSLAENLPPTTYKTKTDPQQFCDHSFSELVKAYLNS